MRNRLFHLKIFMLLFVIVGAFSYSVDYVCAEPPVPLPKFGISIDSTTNPEEATTSVQILVILTILSLAPSILIMMTSFTRIIIVLSFLRNAMGTQQMPPSQVLIGLALFLTLFIMNPVLTDINENSLKPYSAGTISQGVALENASHAIKGFMIKQIEKKDLALFVSLANIEGPIKEDNVIELPLTIIIPSFLISELTTAFKIGFLIYIPFLVIDMVIASTLMSMGMMMLPPVMISLPFKILLFIMVGGWNLLVQTIIHSFER